MFMFYACRDLSRNAPVQALSTEEAEASTCYTKATDTCTDHDVKATSLAALLRTSYATQVLHATSLLSTTASHVTWFTLGAT